MDVWWLIFSIRSCRLSILMLSTRVTLFLWLQEIDTLRSTSSLSRWRGSCRPSAMVDVWRDWLDAWSFLSRWRRSCRLNVGWYADGACASWWWEGRLFLRPRRPRAWGVPSSPVPAMQRWVDAEDTAAPCGEWLWSTAWSLCHVAMMVHEKTDEYIRRFCSEIVAGWLRVYQGLNLEKFTKRVK
jgi:hypothetical protein